METVPNQSKRDGQGSPMRAYNVAHSRLEWKDSCNQDGESVKAPDMPPPHGAHAGQSAGANRAGLCAGYQAPLSASAPPGKHCVAINPLASRDGLQGAHWLDYITYCASLEHEGHSRAFCRDRCLSIVQYSQHTAKCNKDGLS